MTFWQGQNLNSQAVNPSRDAECFALLASALQPQVSVLGSEVSRYREVWEEGSKDGRPEKDWRAARGQGCE